METIIKSNGSKWAGEAPDTLDILEERLKTYKLNIRDFAALGFVRWSDNGNIIRLFGNFTDISHVFNIEGDADNPTLNHLYRLIEENIKNQFEI